MLPNILRRKQLHAPRSARHILEGLLIQVNKELTQPNKGVTQASKERIRVNREATPAKKRGALTIQGSVLNLWVMPQSAFGRLKSTTSVAIVISTRASTKKPSTNIN